MGELERAWEVAGKRGLFEEIHRFKSLYEDILSGVANRVMVNARNQGWKGFRGCKISKGNELVHCPYQVLDIGRDFDAKSGLNIRILHWWGRGTFVFLFVGSDHPRYSLVWDKYFFGKLKARGYRLVDTESRWQYELIIDQGRHRALSKRSKSDRVGSQERLFHVFRQVVLEGEKCDAEAQLIDCVDELTGLFSV
ncbi:hypothetical protein [Lunatimonas salinarum]|uniref:hypothetical protein n=1 Tax=Lunatimonas salinarum TaxID=1774590 RepID=UPI001ADF7BFE|nr:hypothetical protein [Lunatimonas salinarum]